MATRLLAIGILLGATMSVSPSLSEDVQSGQIVFSAATRGNGRPWRFVLIDLATGSQRLLGEYGDGNHPAAPRWSPDGRRFLYSLNVNCDGVFLYDLETGREERLDEGDGCQAAWSPDGQQVAYQRSRAWTASDAQLHAYDLYVLDLRTRIRRQLTRKSGGYPVWSPDGQWIVYYAPAREIRLYRIRSDGSGDEEFPRLPNPRMRPKSLSWSPDGKRLAFSTWPFPMDAKTIYTSSDEEVYTADAAGGDLRLLTPEKWNRAAPVWSPQSNRIALVVNSNEGTGLGSIRLVERGRSREIVAQAYVDQDYDFWSPNGRAIAYTPLNWSTLEGRGVSILNLDNGRVQRVATDELAAYPVWRPLGR